MSKFKTAVRRSPFCGADRAYFLSPDTALSFGRAFETVSYLFALGAIGAGAYIWLADKWSILGRVVRTNLPATLKALVIAIPIATVLSLVRIPLHPPADAQVWIFLAVLFSCIISDAAYARRRRVYES